MARIPKGAARVGAARPTRRMDARTIKNKALLRALREVKAGTWAKVYHYGKDGSEIHYCQHSSGLVLDVEHHPR